MLDPAKLGALERMAKAMKAAKAAKKRGFNIQQVRATLDQATKAFMAKDYSTAADLADRAMEMLGLPRLP